MREDCSLCGKVYPYYALLRCYRCRRLYCRDCVTFTEDRNVVCLNCARRMVSPRRLGTKYSPLSRYLARRARFTNQATLTFAQVEGIIGDNLPLSALRYRHWWTNTHSRVQAQAWLNVGWVMHDVDLKERVVTFRRVGSPEIKPHKRTQKRRRSASALFQKSLRLTKPRRLRTPSKSRIARAQARLKNVERKKSSTQRYRGRLKPQPAFEKRLYAHS